MMDINHVARELGMDPIVCPHCLRKFSMKRTLHKLLRRMMETVISGTSVVAPRIGVFRQKQLAKDTRFNVLMGRHNDAPIRTTVRFEPHKDFVRCNNR